MLLAGLHRHAQRRVTGRVFGDADNAPRHGAFKFIFRGKEGGMRAAVAHRHAETLRGAENNIGTLLARRGQVHQRHQVGGNADHDFA